MGSICFPSNLLVETLAPTISKCDLFGNGVMAGVIVRMSQWSVLVP